jgi:isoquinoline 1-oxidoreductase beta subunit
MGAARIARRTFLIGSAAVAGGVAIGYYQVKTPWPNPLKPEAAGEGVFNPYVKIAPDNTITVIVPRAEMGQGVRTTLAAAVAEELNVALADIKVEHGPASFAYYNSAGLADGGPFAKFDQGFIAEAARGAFGATGKLLGLQMTGGSSSTVDGFDKMRKAGATARALLIQAAAAEAGKPETAFTAEAGHVVDRETGERRSYGQLAAKAATLKVPADIALKPKAEWTLLGKDQPRVDGIAKSTGKAVYGIDIDLPGMLYATVRMNPHLGGGIRSFDAAKAKAMPGVKAVADIGGGIVVIADNTWRAFLAAEAVAIEWEKGSLPATTDAAFSPMTEKARLGEGFAFRNDGDTAEIVKASKPEDTIEAEYRAPFLAHACMEPMNATAHWKDGRLDIWVPTQVPTLVQMAAAREFGIAADAANVHVTLLGGGFGRRLEIDFAVHAMRAAKLTDGRPVKVTWTREEDMRHDMYRPGAVAKFRGVVSKGGMPVALEGVIASPSVIKSIGNRIWPYIPIGGPDKTVAEGAFDQPYDISNYRIAGAVADSSVPVGFWRSVGNSYNGFFHETFLDELAHKAGLDPIKMRLTLMEKWPAAANAVRTVAEMSGWETPLPRGKGRGCAFTLSFGTWVAQVVQVAVEDKRVRIEKVWCAADVGTALDPRMIEAQMQSGIVFGLSSAIGQEITFREGAVEQANFTDFDAMRINQAPAIEVAVLETSPWMGGVGEPGTPPSIPALGNAIFAATGKRLRTLPFSREFSF